MSRYPVKDYMGPLLERGIDVNRRAVYLFGEITIEKAEDVILGLQTLSTVNQEKPIELYINSIGGCIDNQFAIHDAIRVCSCPVSTICIGTAYSAAALLVAAGDKGRRYCTKHSKFMVHPTTMEMEGKTAQLDAEIKQLRACTGAWLDLMAEYTKLSRKQWDNYLRRNYDVYISSGEAVEYGLVDFIWGE